MHDDHVNPDRADVPGAAEKAHDELADGQPVPFPQGPKMAVPAPPEPVRDLGLVDSLPAFTPASEIPKNLTKLIAMNYPELVEGMIHRGTKVVIGGASKSFKSWMTLQLGLAVATGSDFFGRASSSGPVVYVNLEIPHEFAMLRVRMVSQSLGIELPANFYIWSLRGLCNDFSKLSPILKLRAAKIQEETDQDIQLVVIDPIYKGLGDRDENAAGDMASLMGDLDGICKATGAALVYSHHFAKGSAAAKEAQDRMSGSGVIARDADSMIIMTPHEEDGAFTISIILRNFAPVPDFVLRWKYPVFEIDERLDPQALRRPGRPKSVDSEPVLNLLPDEGLKSTEWLRECVKRGACSERSFYRTIKALEEDGIIERQLDKSWRKTELHKS